MGTTTGHRIAEAARLSGFPAASLRYYEQIGLMPPMSRSESGYRIYTDRDIDRLRFISRAKQLGCTLEEITELAMAWDNDECAPVQHRLAALVDRKVIETQSRIVELVQLAAELQATAASLARMPGEGPCDDSCGCMTLVEPAEAPVAVSLIAKPPASDNEDVPIACSLDAADMPTRLTEWQGVLHHTIKRTPLAGGIRLRLSADVSVDEVVRLAGAEHDCCQFFAFAITIDGRGVGLEITAPPDAADMVTAVFGSAA